MRLSEPLRHFHQNVQNAAFVENLIKPTSKLYIIGKAERVETVFDFVESWVGLVNRREELEGHGALVVLDEPDAELHHVLFDD